MANERRRRPPTRSAGLDQPLARGRSLRPAYDPEQFGRLSERVARYIGSWKFIAWMTVIIILWVLWNTLAPVDLRPDTFPFILLAQNRQADRDRVQFAEDRQNTERLIADAEYLAREVASLRMALGELATRDYLRGEIRELLEELEERLDARESAERALDDEGRA